MNVTKNRNFELKSISKDSYAFSIDAFPKGLAIQKGNDAVFVPKKFIICIDFKDSGVFVRLSQNMGTCGSIIDELEEPYIMFKTSPITESSVETQKKLFEYLVKWYNTILE
jgi:hypothetical protein